MVDGRPCDLSESTLALSNLKVAVLGYEPAGLLAGSFLGDLGAQVVRVDLVGRDDPLRSRLPMNRESSLSWPIIARSVKSATCNIDDPEGAILLRRLIENFDVVIESLGPEGLERLFQNGLEFPQSLVLVRVSGYGQTGPYRFFPSDDLTASAFSGLAYLTGHRDGPPMAPGTAIADNLCAVFAVQSAIAALYGRLDTGYGDVIDATLYGGALRITEWAIPVADRLGINREREGNFPRPAAPYGVFSSKDGQYVAICVGRNDHFRRVTESVDDSGVDPKDITPSLRAKVSDKLNDKLGAWAGNRTIDEIEVICLNEGVPFGRVYSAREIVSDPHFSFRGDLMMFEDSKHGPIVQSAPYPRHRDSTPRIFTTPSDAGADNQFVWGDLVGLSDEELQFCRANGRI